MVAYVSKKMLVVDGHSMAYRAFFALPVEKFTTSGGQSTNAIYGFLSMLTRLLDTESPSHIAVAFDLPSGSFRDKEYPEYKAGRSETPEEFKGQVSIISEMLSRMGIRTLTKEDYEADDILATLTKQGSQAGLEVLIASGDRDTFQLVSDSVTVIYPGRSASDLRYMTPEAVEERYGVPPVMYPEIAALVGETADNLPGVPGVGDKTAAQWLKKYGGLTNLLENADAIGGKRGEALREHLDDVRRNRRLNHLVDDVELGVDIPDLVPTAANHAELEDLFDTLDFARLRDRVYRALNVEREVVAEEQASQPDFSLKSVTIVGPETDVSAWLQDRSDFTLGYLASGRTAEQNLVGFALLSDGDVLAADPAHLDSVQEAVFARFFASDAGMAVHGAKPAMQAFQAQGWEFPPVSFETELAAYLVRPDRRGYRLDDLAAEYLGETVPEEDDGALFSLGEITEGSSPRWAQALADRAALTYRLVEPLRDILEKQDMLPLLTEVEIPTQKVLNGMEIAGIAIDMTVLETLAKEFREGVALSRADAYAAAGREVNLGSPKQLQVVLFEELGMPKTRKTKTGWTTDAAALTDLFAKTGHPFLEALLRHRDFAKLLQMVEGLMAEVRPDGRIHTTFQQTVTATGRLASSDPNLQNIPTRSDLGIRVREAFVNGPGYADLMSVDYSQIEMRIMAHLSEDAELIAAFKSGEDLHRTMAAMIFGVPVDEVTPELRARIKATSYGLAYGLSPFGLSKQLDVSVEEARELHAKYFERFGDIGRYLQEVVEEARVLGYTETMLGRRRYFPGLQDDSRRVQEMAERAALNAPIQGTAADIIKLATNRVERELEDGGFKSRLLLQVHDELVLEIAEGERDRVENMVRDAMGSAADLSVPLDVAVGVGHSWRDAAH